ncbi:MAG: hypothetical protein LBK53_07940 [Heliobacteriaceae bacterium]|nr:hypothetical protein [Heliobacteriaceae bacterium]
MEGVLRFYHVPDPETADFGGRETPIVSKTTLLRTADNPRQVQDDVAEDVLFFHTSGLLYLPHPEIC